MRLKQRAERIPAESSMKKCQPKRVGQAPAMMKTTKSLNIKNISV
jgi:hypothetical protein